MISGRGRARAFGVTAALLLGMSIHGTIETGFSAGRLSNCSEYKYSTLSISVLHSQQLLTQDLSVHKSAELQKGSSQIEPDSTLEFYRQGKDLWRERKYGPAIEKFDAALREDPRFLNARIMRGITESDQGNHERAISDFTEAIRLEPDSATAIYGRAGEYRVQKDYTRSLQDYEHVLLLTPQDPDALYGRGMDYVELGNADLAIRDLDRSIQIKPDYANAHIARGLAYFHKGLYDRAIENYNEAIRLEPTSATAYHDRGVAYFRKGFYLRSITDRLHALLLRSGSPRIILFLSLAIFATLLVFVFKQVSRADSIRTSQH
jgi:tetratricopeptide (TPR) repeat protein